MTLHTHNKNNKKKKKERKEGGGKGNEVKITFDYLMGNKDSWMKEPTDHCPNEHSNLSHRLLLSSPPHAPNTRPLHLSPAAFLNLSSICSNTLKTVTSSTYRSGYCLIFSVKFLVILEAFLSDSFCFSQRFHC